MSEGGPVDPRKVQAAREAFQRLLDQFAVESERLDVTRLELWRALLECMLDDHHGDERVRECCREALRKMDERGL